MRVLKGFACHSRFVKNAVDAINNIGELSTKSLTFTKEVGYYSLPTPADITLASFLNSSDGSEYSLDTDPDFRDHVLTIATWIYGKTIKAGGEVFADEILNGLITDFADKASDFSSGQIVTDGSYYIPEWISWQYKAHPDCHVKIWFSNGSFESQYDEFKIVVVPPIPNLDDFFKLGTVVESIVKAVTLPALMDLVQQAKNNHPETILRSESYDWIDQVNLGHKVNTNWTVLIYGPFGNNIDSIKDALTGYILAHSTHSRDEWVKIFPDIFKRTEFIFAPNWESYAIPNRVTQNGIYSPFTKLTDGLTYLEQHAPGYPITHINTYAQAHSHMFKSLAVVSIGSIENRNNAFMVTDLFPDYLNVSTSSTDFNRMSADTRGFSEMLNKLIIMAEEATEFSGLPMEVTRVKRSGLLFLVQSYLNVHFLVAMKNKPALPPVLN